MTGETGAASVGKRATQTEAALSFVGCISHACFGSAGDDSIMLEAILVLLNIASCALVIVVWGADLLGKRS